MEITGPPLGEPACSHCRDAYEQATDWHGALRRFSVATVHLHSMATSAVSPMSRSLADTDPEIASAIGNETRRQAEGLELIASENFVSTAVLEAAGSVMTNKYAEGYPGRRYYGGCEFVDVAESLAISRAKTLFGADHANVQPHSGAQANMAVYLTLLKPGETVLGMNWRTAGTHARPPPNSPAALYDVRRRQQGRRRIDYAERERGHEHRRR